MSAVGVGSARSGRAAAKHRAHQALDVSEGLASFSALTYLQARRRRNVEYYRFLDQYLTDILSYRDRAGPISIGYRNATPDTPNGYDYITYEKGAWVFHMLRIMMLDLTSLRTERMNATLRDFYQAFRGGAADTYDFQAVVERHLGVRMDWFFDQWVRGTAIPTYHVAWTREAAAAGRFRVRLRITQEHVPEDKTNALRAPCRISAALPNASYRPAGLAPDATSTRPPKGQGGRPAQPQ